MWRKRFARQLDARPLLQRCMHLFKVTVTEFLTSFVKKPLSGPFTKKLKKICEFFLFRKDVREKGVSE